MGYVSICSAGEEDGYTEPWAWGTREKGLFEWRPLPCPSDFALGLGGGGRAEKVSASSKKCPGTRNARSSME